MTQSEDRETKTFFKVFWAWEDEKEEQWLEEQALQGYHLLSVAPFFYEFEKGPSQQVKYRLDYKVTVDKDYQEYQSLFQDSNWELVTRMSNWHYYRVDLENKEVPELYSSNRTKAQKYRRLLAGLFPSIVILFVVINPTLYRSSSESSGVFGTIYQIAHIFFILILFFLIYGVIRILTIIRKLESETRE